MKFALNKFLLVKRLALIFSALASLRVHAESQNTLTSSSTSTSGVSDRAGPSNHAYTASEIAARLVAPETVADLLRNLKETLNLKLLLQPSFFDDSVLLKCFGASRVSWHDGPVPGTKDAVVDTIEGRLGKMEITLRRGTIVYVTHHRKSGHSGRPSTLTTGVIRMNVESVPGFTADAVQLIFGTTRELFYLPIDAPIKSPAGKDSCCTNAAGPDYRGALRYVLNEGPIDGKGLERTASATFAVGSGGTIQSVLITESRR